MITGLMVSFNASAIRGIRITGSPTGLLTYAFASVGAIIYGYSQDDNAAKDMTKGVALVGLGESIFNPIVIAAGVKTFLDGLLAVSGNAK